MTKPKNMYTESPLCGNISVVVCVYNTGPGLEELVRRIIACDDNDRFPIREILLVDDGSDETTSATLSNLKRHFEKVNVHRLEKNVGQQQATLTGILMAKGSVICTIDDDLEYRPEDLRFLYRELFDSSADIVYGIRETGNLLWWRRLIHIFFYTIARLKGYPRVSSMRCMHSRLLDGIDPRIYRKRPHLMLDSMLIDKAGKLCTVPISFTPAFRTRQHLGRMFLHFLDFLFSRQRVTAKI